MHFGTQNRKKKTRQSWRTSCSSYCFTDRQYITVLQYSMFHCIGWLLQIRLAMSNVSIFNYNCKSKIESWLITMCRYLITCMMQQDSLLDFVTRRRKLHGYTSPEQVPCITHLAVTTLPARDVQLFCNIYTFLYFAGAGCIGLSTNNLLKKSGKRLVKKHI